MNEGFLDVVLEQFKLLPAYSEQLIAVIQSACRTFLCEESLLFLLEVCTLIQDCWPIASAQVAHRHEVFGAWHCAQVNDLQKREEAQEEQVSALLETAQHIAATYVKPGSDYEINISSNQVHRCLDRVKGFAGWYEEVASKDPARVRERKVAPAFAEAFDEIERMLAQNIMKHVEAQEEYHLATASHFIQTNNLS
jgi:hypothetical protein